MLTQMVECTSTSTMCCKAVRCIDQWLWTWRSRNGRWKTRQSDKALLTENGLIWHPTLFRRMRSWLDNMYLLWNVQICDSIFSKTILVLHAIEWDETVTTSFGTRSSKKGRICKVHCMGQGKGGGGGDFLSHQEKKESLFQQQKMAKTSRFKPPRLYEICLF